MVVRAALRVLVSLLLGAAVLAGGWALPVAPSRTAVRAPEAAAVLVRAPVRRVARPVPAPPPRSSIRPGASQLGCPPRVGGARPVNGSSATAARRLSRATPLELMIAGDSMPEYAGRHLIGRGDDRGLLVACLETRYSTGLARPDFWNWGIYAHRLIERRDPEAVVFMIGGNDCQNLWQPDGRLAVIGTRAWVLEYRRRAGQVMSTFSGPNRRRLYWVGMPIARRPDLASCFARMNAAVRSAAAGRPGVVYLDIWQRFSTRDGRYADVLPDDAGHPTVVRQKDGIHLSYRGSAMLAQTVLQRINADWHLTA